MPKVEDHISDQLRREMEKRAYAEEQCAIAREELAFLKGVILRADNLWTGTWAPILSDWQAMAARYGKHGERFMDGVRPQ